MSEQPVLAITGTSRGIGLGMAKFFVGQGYQVAGCSRSESVFSANNYLHTQVNLTDETQVRHWIRTIKSRYGRIDILVCNAATVPTPTFLALTSADVVDGVLRTNVIGTYLACREAAKAMLLQQSGRIITVSSIAVALHEEGTAVYSASKSAVIEMTKVLAKELGSRGITCNVIAPSVFMSQAVENLGEAVTSRTLEHLTIKREVTIEEICNVVRFFAAPESSCVTGQVLYLGIVN